MEGSEKAVELKKRIPSKHGGKKNYKLNARYNEIKLIQKMHCFVNI